MVRLAFLTVAWVGGLATLASTPASAMWLQADVQEGTPAGVARENQVFDAVRQAPGAYLRDAYAHHQLLVLSFAEHDNERQYRALELLLDQVGQDARLTNIVLERLRQTASVLEAASVTDLDEAHLERALADHFTDLDGQPAVTGPVLPGLDQGAITFDSHTALCYSEWAYAWARLLPRVRALNATRPAAQPVRVTAVDGIDLSLRAGLGLESYERDSTTAARFAATIWPVLQRDTAAKAIVVYNIVHTLLGFTAKRAGQTVAPTFLDMFLGAHPEARARTALVMIEGSATGDHFQLTVRQRARTQNEPFGVPTAPFRGVTAEQGAEVLTASARPATYNEGLRSTATLADMVDGIVVLPAAAQAATQAGAAYFPTACANRGP